MSLHRARGTYVSGLTALLLGSLSALASDAPERPAQAPASGPSSLEFFEKEVRPLLAARCQGCHGQEKQKGELRLDSLEAVLKGGSSGPAVEPGKPDDSPLIDAINYGDLVKMPPKSKLAAREIATLTRWVAIGAPWPKHDVPKADVADKVFDLKERARHWSFQPLRVVAPPDVKKSDWPRTAIDRFILAGLEAKKIAPAPEADKRTLIRRTTFDLIGLPPTPAEIDAFLADDSPPAFEKVVDRLLASPRYGERWARHWLDLVRYAETSGHEYDYDIPGAYQYRDYVIRAFNADVPYDQFATEHIAGDLLPSPRLHPADGFNESVLGTGFFLLGEGTHSPVDVLEDESARVDNQIDVFSKTFLGLTVACARCHDHKFDPITTKDYYALAGYLQSSRHQHAFIDPPPRIAARVAELSGLKRTIRAGLEGSRSRLESPVPTTDSSIPFADFDGLDYANWSVAGDAFGNGPTRTGEFLVRRDQKGASVLTVAPGLAHSGLVSDRLQGVLRSPTFTIEKKFIHHLAAGKRGRINVVIDGFEKIRDPIYGGLTIEINSGDDLRWHTQNVGMWLGQKAYLEIADGATVNYTGALSGYWSGDGYIAVDEIRFSDQDAPRTGPRSTVEKHEGPIGVPESILAKYLETEASIPPPTLALALTDGTPEDERVHIRGSHLTLGPVVPRRFLEVIAGAEQSSPRHGSGRLELARRVVEPSNPLFARVIVNRVWKHHFGEGIVKSPDDFGRMGQAPTHPELLDYLADQFMKQGWSIKRMHRMMVCSATYRMSSKSVPASEGVDPANLAYHRMNIRRLEAEAVRDAILAVSGRLDPRTFGPSVPAHLTPFMEGRGRPAVSGPLDGDGRRSLYLGVRRNFLNPMFSAFDFPSPFSTMGRRNVSNVPAQALTLMNDPLVIDQAKLWSDRILADPRSPARERLTRMYVAAFGRPPTERETEEDLAFLVDEARGYGKPDDPRAWADLCHVLLNVKEFIYVN